MCQHGCHRSRTLYDTYGTCWRNFAPLTASTAEVNPLVPLPPQSYSCRGKEDLLVQPVISTIVKVAEEDECMDLRGEFSGGILSDTLEDVRRNTCSLLVSSRGYSDVRSCANSTPKLNISI